MNVNQKNGVTWLTYPAFEKIPGIVHGFSTRLGGVSQGIYESMNLSFTRGKNEVKSNTDQRTGYGERTTRKEDTDLLHTAYVLKPFTGIF